MAVTMLGVPALAQPEVRPFSLAAQGCMKLRECTDDVVKVTSVQEITDYYQDSRADFSSVAIEAEAILRGL